MMMINGTALHRWVIAILFASVVVLAMGRTETAHAAAEVSTTDSEPIRIAVIAHRGIEKARKEWAPTAMHLAKKLSRPVEMIPLKLSDMAQTVRDKTVDFVIVNPGAYVELSLEHGISALATLQKNIEGFPVSAFGGVVFSKSDRTDLELLSDLKENSLLAVSPNSFGGYQVLLREFQKLGIDPETDFRGLTFTGFPQDSVVTRVLAGDGDAGIVRTGVLEAMTREGKINMGDINIIDPITHPLFPLAASTELYPEWAFAKLGHVPETLAKDILRNLLLIRESDWPARLGHYSGWTVPLDYTPVHNLFEELKIGPYESVDVSIEDFIKQYWIAAAFLGLLIIFIVAHSVLARRLVARQTSELSAANKNLQREGEERIRAEETNARLGRILEDSWNEIYIFDAKTYQFIQVNHGALTNMGYSMEEMGIMTAYDIKPHFDCASFIEAVKPLTDGTQQFLVFETEHERKDGTTYPVEVRLQLLSNENPPVYVAVINDITERRRAEREVKELNANLEDRVEERTRELQTEITEREAVEEKLRETEAKTRQIVNSAVDGIITINEQGVIVTYNQAAEGMFGYSVIEAVGNNVKLLMPQNLAEEHDGYLEKYRRTGKARIIGISREVIARRKDGSTFLMELSISEFRHGEAKTFVGIVRDITERKEAEYKLQTTLGELRNTQAELVQTEKMASLGGLVAGIAHEVNTPVGVGVTAASNLKERIDSLSELFESGNMKKSDFEGFLKIASQSTSIISTNLNRAAELIRSFKQVAVDQSSEEIRQFNLHDYLEEILVSLRPQLKKAAHEVTIEGDQDIQLESYPGALSQIVTNLIMNSMIHAYDDGEAGHIRISFSRGPKSIEVLYADDGKGVPPDVLEKIFEPFFTTKRGSGGSGLGMHILYNLITQKLGGAVACESTPGEGITFTITLPEACAKGEAA